MGIAGGGRSLAQVVLTGGPAMGSVVDGGLGAALDIAAEHQLAALLRPRDDDAPLVGPGGGGARRQLREACRLERLPPKRRERPRARPAAPGEARPPLLARERLGRQLAG